MKQTLMEHIEAKIMNLLHDLNKPIPASQIAAKIQEKRQDTLQAVQRLVRNNTIKGVQDLTLFNLTGETMAYVLTVGALPPKVTPPIPIPPSAHAPPFQRGSARH